MEYLARKFARAKWEVHSWFADQDDIAADAVTVCLKTTANSLSCWECQSDEEDVKEVVLALAAGQKPEKMHVIIFQRDELEQMELRWQAREGNTPVRDLVDRHVDLIELTINKLYHIAFRMAQQVRKSHNCFTFTRAEVIEIVRKAVSDSRVALDQLTIEMREAIQR